MKKILICFITVFCFMSFVGQKVSAANTYTQKEIIDGAGIYEAGATIQFEGEVKVEIRDLDNSMIFEQKAETVVLPEYTSKLKSFKGWVFSGVISKDGKVSEMYFVPFFKTDIQFNVVTDGEAITLNVPKDQIPFKEGKYTTEWIVGGMGGGYTIEEAPKNTLTWTIPAGLESYKNGMKIALRVSNEKRKNIFSEEAVLEIKAKAPVIKPNTPDVPVENQKPTSKPTQNKDIVKTDDNQSVIVNALVVLGAIGVIALLKNKKITDK